MSFGSSYRLDGWWENQVGRAIFHAPGRVWWSSSKQQVSFVTDGKLHQQVVLVVTEDMTTSPTMGSALLDMWLPLWKPSRKGQVLHRWFWKSQSKFDCRVSGQELKHLWIHCEIWKGFPCGSAGKESTCNAGDLSLIPGLGRSPGEGKDYPLQYSGLENSMDCIVHGVLKSRTPLSDLHFTVKKQPTKKRSFSLSP